MNSAKINKPIYSPFEKSPFKESSEKNKNCLDYFRNLKFTTIYQRPFTKTKHSLPKSDYDFDVMNDQIIKLKNENAKLIFTVSNCKTQNTRLEETNKKLIKLIEESLTNSAVHFNNHSLPNGENLKFLTQCHDHSGKFQRLREALLISHLKREITELKLIVESKGEELENLKQSNKAINIAHLESKHLKLQEKYSNLKKDFDHLLRLLEKTKEERDSYKFKFESRRIGKINEKNKNRKKMKIVSKSEHISSTSFTTTDNIPMNMNKVDISIENVSNYINLNEINSHAADSYSNPSENSKVDCNVSNSEGKLKKFIDSVFETKHDNKLDAVDKFLSVLKKNRENNKLKVNINSNNTKSNKRETNSTEKTKSTGYLINISLSEPQTFDRAEHFYMKSDSEGGVPVITRRKKSNSHKEGMSSVFNLDKSGIRRAPTLDKFITDKIIKGEEFDFIIEEVMKTKK